MNLCASNNYQKPMYNKKLKCWCVGDMPIPNYNPDDVKFKRHDFEGRWDKLESMIKKRTNKMNEEDKKITVDQLQKRSNDLEKCIESWTRQSAIIGKKLHDALFEYDQVENVLSNLTDDNND